MDSNPPQGDRGFTLVEMLMSVALVSLVLMGAVALILAASKFSIRAVESAGVQTVVCRLFRVLDDEIARAREFPREAEGYVAGPDTLIILGPDGRRSVYLAAEGSLERVALDSENVRRDILAKDLTNFRFDQEGNGVCYSFSTYLKTSRKSLAWEGCSRAVF